MTSTVVSGLLTSSATAAPRRSPGRRDHQLTSADATIRQSRTVRTPDSTMRRRSRRGSAQSASEPGPADVRGGVERRHRRRAAVGDHGQDDLAGFACTVTGGDGAAVATVAWPPTSIEQLAGLVDDGERTSGRDGSDAGAVAAAGAASSLGAGVGRRGGRALVRGLRSPSSARLATAPFVVAGAVETAVDAARRRPERMRPRPTSRAITAAAAAPPNHCIRAAAAMVERAAPVADAARCTAVVECAECGGDRRVTRRRAAAPPGAARSARTSSQAIDQFAEQPGPPSTRARSCSSTSPST